MKDKKIPKTVALEYGNSAAPRVIATAEGDMARLMAEVAISLGIPALRDEHLVEVLNKLELYEDIPENLYVSVAVVLAWAFWLTGRTPDSF
jgi:flagellar biosynthesis protein